MLIKVSRLYPGQINVEEQMHALKRAKRLEHTREKARAGLLSTGGLGSPLSGRLTVEFEAVWNELSKTTIVDRISSDDFSRLFAAVQIIEIAPGLQLAEAGSENEALFLIAKGRVDARTLDAKGHEITLRAFGSGEIFGEAALFWGSPWQASYVCSEPGRALRLGRDSLDKMMADHPDSTALVDILQSQGNDKKIAEAVEHTHD